MTVSCHYNGRVRGGLSSRPSRPIDVTLTPSRSTDPTGADPRGDPPVDGAGSRRRSADAPPGVEVPGSPGEPPGTGAPDAGGRPWPYLWLAIGLVTGILVPSLGVEGRLVAALGTVAPAPWSRIGLGLLIFGLFAALHFRSHWVDSLTRQQRMRQRQESAARRIAEAERDGRRWIRVIQENLELVAEAEQRPGMDDMYLEGARAHADKLEQAFERISGTRRRLGEEEDGS